MSDMSGTQNVFVSDVSDIKSAIVVVLMKFSFYRQHLSIKCNCFDGNDQLKIGVPPKNR